MDSGGRVESSPSTAEVGEVSAVSIDFMAGEAVGEAASVRIPTRIRRRLMESSSKGSSVPSSVEEIEAKLRDADLRRQRFHEWLSSKARPKPRSPSWSSHEEDLGQRLEAKLVAAEQKRLSLLTKAQMRLAKIDELRQAAKNGVEMRVEKEREELGTKVESRVKQAEANRMHLLKAHMQRSAAAKERLKLARNVCHQREIERRRLKEKLEKRLQRAKRQRTEYLRQRGSPCGSARVGVNKHGDLLSRKLGRCWKQFVKSRNTTFALSKAYWALGITENSVQKMPFEELAFLMESAKTIETTKAFFDRLETCTAVFLSSSSSSMDIDHLLKRLGTPNRRVNTGRTTRNRGVTRKARDSKGSEQKKLSRYPVRIVLCAYMILGHQNAVFNGQGDREVSLRDSAIKFIQELELLVGVILDGSSGANSSKKPSLSVTVSTDSSSKLPEKRTFRGQLAAFDMAWRSYLYHFVVWKVKDAKSLEEDLVRAACQLELSMMQTCKISSDGKAPDLTHDMKAIQKQVIGDQKLLREKVQHLSGNAGIERMECALADTRSKFFEARDTGTPPMASHVAHISTPSTSGSWEQPLTHTPAEKSGESNSVNKSGQQSQVARLQSPTENELIVNEILHQIYSSVADSADSVDTDKQSRIRVKIREAMEKAFWDDVINSTKEGLTDYNRIISLVKEVRDELCELAPESLKNEITSSIDLGILTQVLQSGNLDMDYLRRILEYCLVMLQKLSAPATENEMKLAHQNFLLDLVHTAQASESDSFVVVTVKGLRFVLEEIQKLKKEVSKARIQLIEPIIKGSAGFEYLQRAFSDRYGAPTGAANSLPVTLQWLSSFGNSCEEEWNEHTNFISSLSLNNGLPPTTLRAGGSLSTAEKQRSLAGSGVDELPECSGEKVDKSIRLGLLKLASAIEGWTTDTVPETIKLNVSRLRSVQSQFQQVIVTATSMLVLRQILLSENSSTSTSSELQNAVSSTYNGLYELFGQNPDAGIEDIIEVMMMATSSSCSSPPLETKLQARKEMITRVLTKSLQSGDAVFGKVSLSIYLATRGLLFAGTGALGRKLADAALKRVGAAMLLDRVVKVAEVLITMASVTSRVHGPWYLVLMNNI